MKISHCREKVIVFTFSMLLAMGIAACSFDTSGGPKASAEVPRETASLQPEVPTAPEIETPKPETSKPETPTVPRTEADKRETSETTAPEDNGSEYSDAGEINVGDPIIGIVDKFADNIIIIKDVGDPDLVYYFSTQNAQVIEGDSPIAVGDRVAITYLGVMGDEEHPGEAVKVMAESLMYQ